jgi:hypothetical protein
MLPEQSRIIQCFPLKERREQEPLKSGKEPAAPYSFIPVLSITAPAVALRAYRNQQEKGFSINRLH